MSDGSSWEIYVENSDFSLTVGEIREALIKVAALPDNYKIESGYYNVHSVYVDHETKIVNFGNSE